MTNIRPLAMAVVLAAAASGCDLVARPADDRERQVMSATQAELASQAKMIDSPICLDWATHVKRDYIVFPDLWEPAQFSDPVWSAYAKAPLPRHSVRVPGSGSPKGVDVRSALRNDLFCRGWRTKMYTPLFSGPYAYVVVEDAMIFFIYAFVRERGGWRLIRIGTTRKNAIRI